VTVTVWVWVIVGVCLAVAAGSAIGYYALRVFRAVKGLSAEIGRASRALSDASEPIQAVLAQSPNGTASESGSSPENR
jgi:hypothetical protein